MQPEPCVFSCMCVCECVCSMLKSLWPSSCRGFATTVLALLAKAAAVLSLQQRTLRLGLHCTPLQAASQLAGQPANERASVSERATEPSASSSQASGKASARKCLLVPHSSGSSSSLAAWLVARRPRPKASPRPCRALTGAFWRALGPSNSIAQCSADASTAPTHRRPPRSRSRRRRL